MQKLLDLPALIAYFKTLKFVSKMPEQHPGNIRTAFVSSDSDIAELVCFL
jgi:hypothetical protein